MPKPKLPKPMKRRDFLKLTATAALVAPALTAPLWAAPKGPMRILILGGTGFIGPHQVEAALGRGHQVTIFNRGKSGPDMFPQVENLVGDRDNDLSALKGKKWDAVIDNSGFVPRWVKQSAELLKPTVGQYLYMSSISIYADTSVIGLAENGKLHKLEDPNAEDPSNGNYGGMKALSEQYLSTSFPNTATLMRSGLVVGPGDPTDRFTYWPVRVFEGGEVLAPGTPKDPIQCIDVRDLARWTIEAVENRYYGAYNLTGPYHQMTMGEFLDTVKSTTNSQADLTWVTADFLAQEKVTPWKDMPLWVPPDSNSAGFVRIDVSKAVNAGLTFRPIADTVQDSLAWYRTVNPNEQLKAGLSKTREAELLKKWHQTSKK